MDRILMAVLAALILAGCSDAKEELMKELVNPDPVKRGGAVRTLATLGDDEAYSLLKRAMQDPSVVVRIAAIQTLAKFPNQDVTAPLVRATQDSDPEVRQVAIEKLAAKGGPEVKKALLNLLMKGESDLQVRKVVFALLAKQGLTGEQLAGELAVQQIARIQLLLEQAKGIDRVQLILEAGRSIAPGGVEILVQALTETDPDVVLAALVSLDGRGEAQALARLQLLVADPVDRIRLAAIRAAGRFDAQATPILMGALRDPLPNARRLALEQLVPRAAQLRPADLCPLLEDPDGEVALQAALVVQAGKHKCPLESLLKNLRDPLPVRASRAIAILGLLADDRATEALAGEPLLCPAELRPMLATTLAVLGKGPQGLTGTLRRELEEAAEAYLVAAQPWVKDGIHPTSLQASPARPEKRLSDEEINQLYKQHGLPTAGKEAPRSVSDLLRAFPEAAKEGTSPKMFVSIDPQEVERLGWLLSANLRLDAKAITDLVDRLLCSPEPAVVHQAAAAVLATGFPVQKSPEVLGNLGQALKKASLAETGAIASLLASTRDPEAAPALAGALEHASWEKRGLVIQAMGRLGRVESVGPLLEMLSGYSSSAAAMALAEIGDASTVPALRKALDKAGPSEEMEILMALARLGDREVLARLQEKLLESDPEVRRLAVRALKVLGGAEADQALQNVRFDIDRLVRQEATEALSPGPAVEKKDDGTGKKMEGRGSGAAPEGQVRESPGAVPEGGGAGPGR
jgi:HEAT repeat protein